ncbi:MazG family protein [Sanguibacter sp. HDW7]|uniref:MazG family protein n=1 Tax=Sanguibacter sp. HDW7 TaxID=2714931 RepID=UPI00140D22CE|nr:MazG family protein [Sanguibacter sp. HDW7]QIK84189.1 MazG family protein [Sanguibacter sp. HDW7]
MSNAWDDLVGTMDRLRSPGGCPWDAEQTHESLVRYLLEESAELAEAIETGDRAGLREELGDVLLQVVFHARVAQEDAEEPFDVEDVVRDLTAKLVHRHPHVFAGTPLGDLDAQWDALKAREKRRESVLDGIPAGLGALAAAQKVRGRLRRAGLLEEALREAGAPARSSTSGADGVDGAGAGSGASSGNGSDRAVGGALSASLAARLEALVVEAEASGVDMESVLRGRTTRLAAAARQLEAQQFEA